MGKNFRETLNEELKSNADFKREYDSMELEYQLINAILDARKEKNLTQKELSDITGIAQSDISRIETGNANPSLQTIERIANGVGKKIKLEFI